MTKFFLKIFLQDGEITSAGLTPAKNLSYSSSLNITGRGSLPMNSSITRVPQDLWALPTLVPLLVVNFFPFFAAKVCPPYYLIFLSTLALPHVFLLFVFYLAYFILKQRSNCMIVSHPSLFSLWYFCLQFASSLHREDHYNYCRCCGAKAFANL